MKKQEIIEKVTNKIKDIPYIQNCKFSVKVEKFTTDENIYYVWIQTDLPWINLVVLNDLATEFQDDAISVSMKEEGINLLTVINI